MSTTTVGTPTHIFRFLVPKTQKFIFETYLKGVDDTTSELFRGISNTREELKGTLDTESMQVASTVIDRYLPQLLGLVKAIESLPSEFSKGVRIIWTMPLSFKYSSNPLVNQSLRFESLMVLLTYAVLLRNMAQTQLNLSNTDSLQEFDEKSKTIANLLCKAAGIFQHIAQTELPKWNSKPDVPIPESQDQLYTALSTLCLAEASQITIKKGVLKGTSPSALTKLTTDLFQKYEYIYSTVKSFADVQPSFLNYLNINMNLWKSITLRLQAEDYYSKGKYGLAVQYINQSAVGLEDRKDPNLEQFLASYNLQKQYIKELAAKYANENETIYFDVIPTDTIIFPEGKSLVKITPFEAPQASTITVVQKEGSQCTIS